MNVCDNLGDHLVGNIYVKVCTQHGNAFTYLSLSISLSLGSKPIAIDFNRLILFTLVLFAPHHQPSLRVWAWDRHRYLWRGFGVCVRQKSRSKFLPWPGFEPLSWQSNGCEHYH